MFKLAKKRTVDWPVTVKEPQDGGGTAKRTFTATFEVLTQGQLEAVAKDGEDLLSVVLVGWKDVADADGNALDFGDDAKRRVLDVPYVRAALFAAYGEIQRGEGARKNA